MNFPFHRAFHSPGAAYRGKPFWAWNGKLEPAELRRQIRVFKQMGLGGFFMHSRVGLATRYLSRDWFTATAACIDEAKKIGLEAWLYDEDRWPSGPAGGLVTRNPKYRARSLVLDRTRNPRDLKWTCDVLAAFTATVRGSAAFDVNRIPCDGRPNLGKDEFLLIFRIKVAPNSDWFNGYTYLDTLNPKAVARFIEITHEAYRKRFARHFGKTVIGMFTDEPNHCGKFLTFDVATKGEGLPWTDQLPAVFKKRYGYDLIPHLPELFFDVDAQPVTPARRDYHDCTTFLFMDSFARPIGAWCEENNLIHTGHVLLEETLSLQTSVVGSAMRFYEHMQAPGMDILTQHLREYDTAKQVSSVARQFGKKWRLTETYGCTGWDFPFLGHKSVGDWQVALGINLRCQHLAWYTMQGESKRDYPASISYQSPWWTIYSAVEDYFARIHVAMTRGREVRDLLVIHPVESMWVLFNQEWEKNPKVSKLDRMLMDLRDTLLATNIDFDYGDEDILARHGKIRRTKGSPELIVGQAAYTTVLVPPLLTLRRTTLELLCRFKSAGGDVIFAGESPGFVDARPSRQGVEFAARCPRTPAKGPALVAAVEPTCRRISITGPNGRQIVPALHLLREDRDACYLFVCNTGHNFLGKPRDPAVLRRRASFEDVRITGFSGCKGAPVELDPQTGRSYCADARRTPSGGWEIRTSLGPVGSRLFVIPKRFERTMLPPRPKLKDTRVTKLNPVKWDIALSECNNLVLDRPRYRIDHGRWQGSDEILRVDRVVRKALGIPNRGAAMVQPWAQKKVRNSRNIPLELKYDFHADTLPEGDLFLGLECPNLYRLYVNGTLVPTTKPSGWWTDHSLLKIPISPSLLRVGNNEIGLSCEYSENHPGLEIIYLLGSFGVKVHGTVLTMTKIPTSLKLGNWVTQGLAFYSGSAHYQTTITPDLERGQRLFIQVPRYQGAAVRILINDQPVGILAWPPYELDITDKLTSSTIHLGIEVFGHRRNSHGPLHFTDKSPMGISPGSYLTTGKDWSGDYQLVACGLMEPPLLIMRKTEPLG